MPPLFDVQIAVVMVPSEPELQNEGSGGLAAEQFEGHVSETYTHWPLTHWYVTCPLLQLPGACVVLVVPTMILQPVRLGRCSGCRQTCCN